MEESERDSMKSYNTNRCAAFASLFSQRDNSRAMIVLYESILCGACFSFVFKSFPLFGCQKLSVRSFFFFFFSIILANILLQYFSAISWRNIENSCKSTPLEIVYARWTTWKSAQRHLNSMAKLCNDNNVVDEKERRKATTIHKS